MADGEQGNPRFRVSDRRHWALEGDAGNEPQRERKPTYVGELESQLEQARTQLRDTVAQHRSVSEEYEQASARARRDVGKEIDRAKRVMLVEFLEVLDNLDRAIAAAQKEASSTLLQGVTMARDQFLTKLKALGICRVESLGERFDPARHEAVSTVPVTDRSQDGVVLGVIRDSYAIQDDILRPAQVAVGRFPTTARPNP